jgi:hypothetical protein
MGRPGFYNDNEYRSYPFIDKPTVFESLPRPLPPSAIVDACFIMAQAAEYDDSANSVYLREVRRTGNQLFFYITATTPNDPISITFRRNVNTATEWLTEHAFSGLEWDGFIVTGDLTALIAAVDSAGGFISFPANTYQIEPARVQNLKKGHVSSIQVGNRARTMSPVCSDDPAAVADTSTEIFLNSPTLTGNIVFKEGYNARITQVDRANSLTFTAEKNAGMRADDDLCENHSEIPILPPIFVGGVPVPPPETDEKPLIHEAVGDIEARRSLFLSGGWACKDLIFTINGLGGSNINIVGGKNIQVGYDDATNAITVGLSQNAQGQCNNG